MSHGFDSSLYEYVSVLLRKKYRTHGKWEIYSYKRPEGVYILDYIEFQIDLQHFWEMH